MPNANDQIESRIRAFVDELSALVRNAALAAVQGVLGGGASVAKRGPGRPRKLTAAPAPAKRGPGRPRKVTAAAPTPSASKGKRPTAQLEKTVEALRQYVVQHPGRRIEQIGPALGVKTKHLALPVKKLLAANTITKKGQKRSTTYWPVAKK